MPAWLVYVLAFVGGAALLGPFGAIVAILITYFVRKEKTTTSS